MNYEINQETKNFISAITLKNIINQIIKNGQEVEVLPHNNLSKGYRGFVVFTKKKENPNEELAFNPIFQFRPEVTETILCNTIEDFEKYKTEAIDKKWLIEDFDDPQHLQKGYTVQNSDGVKLYTISHTTMFKNT